MRKSVKFTGIIAIAVALTSVSCVSAFADSRHQDATWRNEHRNDGRNARHDDRDFLRGVVERVDRRRDVVVVHESRSGRSVAVEMRRRGQRNGVDVDDLRRGDRVTFVGDWSGRGAFQARRIADVDRGRSRR